MAKDKKGMPPVDTRFQPGKSGNPRGRPKSPPKSAKDLLSRLVRALAEKVVVQEGRRKRQVDKLELALMQMINKAAQGDSAALKVLLAQMQKAEAAQPTGTPQEELAEADHEVIAHVIQRIRQQERDR